MTRAPVSLVGGQAVCAAALANRLQPSEGLAVNDSDDRGWTTTGQRPPLKLRQWQAVPGQRFFRWRGGYPDRPRLVRVRESCEYTGLVPCAPALSWDGKTWEPL